MLKLTLLIWIIMGVTVAGIAIVPLLAMPSLADKAMTLIPLICGAAFLVALPVSYAVAKKIAAQTGEA